MAILVRGDQEVNEIKLLRVLGVDEITLADDRTVEQVTGAPVGFAGALGLGVPLWADETLRGLKNFIMGANEGDRHYVDLNWERDIPLPNWADLRQVKSGEPCPRCRNPLESHRGIEVGHVFKLGDKYSQALKATYLDADGKEHYLYMGCYGIGVSRIMAAAIEQGHDANGIIFPVALAPFQVGLIPIAPNDPAVRECVESLHADLEAAGVEVLLDDRDERPGVKFKDCDLLGLPLRVVVGAKALAQGQAEVRHRRAPDNLMVPLPDLIAYLKAQIAQEQHG